MKTLVTFALALCAVVPAMAQTNVGVSVSVAQPGVYGRIDIGNMPPPPVVYAQPVVIVPTPVAVHRQPIYLYVPPGHQKNWSKHCRRYGACGQPVYFVQEAWVRERYEAREDRRGPRHRAHEAHGKGHKDKSSRRD